MAALDFPPGTTVGQTYPDPPVAGVPVYTWDGEKWTAVSGAAPATEPADAIPLMDATPGVIGTSTDYAREDHVHPTDITRAPDADAVKTTAQTLTATQQMQARKNVYAAPFDAMAYYGMQVNGGMEASQEHGYATITNPYWAVDQERIGTPSGSFGWGAAQYNVFPPGYGASLTVLCNSAAASLPGDAGIHAFHPIEGHRFRRCMFGTANASPVTIGEWVLWQPISGTPSFKVAYSIRSGNSTANYVTGVTVPANVWTWVTMTIPGATIGTGWDGGFNIGCYITRCLASGPATQAPSQDVWRATGNYFALSDGGNLLATAGNRISFTGLLVLPGNEAPPAERTPFIMRTFDQEIELCKRYWRKSYPYSVSVGSAWGPAVMYGCTSMPNSDVAQRAFVDFGTTMRANPSVIPFASNGAQGSWDTGTGNRPCNILVACDSGFMFECSFQGATSTDWRMGGNYLADARF